MCNRRQTTNTTPSAVDARNLVSKLDSNKCIPRSSDWRNPAIPIVLTCRFNIWLPPPTPFSFRDVGCLPIRILHLLAKHQPSDEGLVVVQTENLPSHQPLGILSRIRTPTRHSKAGADEAMVPSGLPSLQSGTKLRLLRNTEGRTTVVFPRLAGNNRQFIELQTTGQVRHNTLPFSSPIHHISPSSTRHTPKTSPSSKFPVLAPPPPNSPQLGSRPPTETQLSRLGAERLSPAASTQCPRMGCNHPSTYPRSFHTTTSPTLLLLLWL